LGSGKPNSPLTKSEFDAILCNLRPHQAIMRAQMSVFRSSDWHWAFLISQISSPVLYWVHQSPLLMQEGRQSGSGRNSRRHHPVLATSLLGKLLRSKLMFVWCLWKCVSSCLRVETRFTDCTHIPGIGRILGERRYLWKSSLLRGIVGLPPDWAWDSRQEWFAPHKEYGSSFWTHRLFDFSVQWKRERTILVHEMGMLRCMPSHLVLPRNATWYQVHVEHLHLGCSILGQWDSSDIFETID
jgi:hypothetical protein